ncbi:ureidoglycolate lyase [Nocardia sp. alder85J]|uniref:ureidoglycolate lyase n=1 Tax=Nocardia sp. alder85J TaxID=2862949 RepID=UPI001CD3F940|nr:ureidoglycolate lyase [Nocardia sp. alder85J]MCX4092867.1 ureidoglycolate lyase [Nocardia sp. alder85J]
MDPTLDIAEIPCATLTPEAFAPFGVVVATTPDGTPFTPADDALDLTAGTPRFYIMQLADRPATFTGITRHRRSTQTLMSADAHDWYLAVAPADRDIPAVTDIRAFRIPAAVAVTLAKGTWHAGPFFTTATMAFANLELADTNITDHDTYRFDRTHRLRCVLDLRDLR